MECTAYHAVGLAKFAYALARLRLQYDQIAPERFTLAAVALRSIHLYPSGHRLPLVPSSEMEQSYTGAVMNRRGLDDAYFSLATRGLARQHCEKKKPVCLHPEPSNYSC